MGDSGSWETSLAQAIAKISHQAQKVKSKPEEKRHSLKAPAPEPLEPIVKRAKAKKAAGDAAPRPVRSRGPRVLRTSREPIKPMSIATPPVKSKPAATASSCSGTPQSQVVSVLYRRPNGELTLVETEA